MQFMLDSFDNKVFRFQVFASLYEDADKDLAVILIKGAWTMLVNFNTMLCGIDRVPCGLICSFFG